MSALAPDPRSQLRKVLAQQDADEEGVIVASALAAKRILAAHGLRWRDILPEILPEPDDTGWRDTIDRCIGHANRLSDWEIQFLLSLRAFASISPKQQRRLDIIASKVRT